MEGSLNFYLTVFQAQSGRTTYSTAPSSLIQNHVAEGEVNGQNLQKKRQKVNLASTGATQGRQS